MWDWPLKKRFAGVFALSLIITGLLFGLLEIRYILVFQVFDITVLLIAIGSPLFGLLLLRRVVKSSQ